MSTLGGILSEMGLEEFGEGMAGIGNWVTIIGGGVSSALPLANNLVKVLEKGGKTTAQAWGWIGAVAAIIAAIGIAIIGIA